jgi:hypothetical protein
MKYRKKKRGKYCIDNDVRTLIIVKSSHSQTRVRTMNARS